MEMETSDEDAEDGQITKFEQEEEKERKLLGMAVTNEPMAIADLNKVRLTRDALAKHFLAPWFEDYVKGTASAEFFLPSFDGSRQERMCATLWERKNTVSTRSVVSEPFAHHLYPLTPLLEVQNLSKHYKINDKITCNLALELKYGTSVEVVPMDRVSNVDFNEVRESGIT
jgi:RNA polymerase-associated protein RTF1